MKANHPYQRYALFTHVVLWISALAVLMACSLKYPRYDEIVGLTPELSETGNSLIRTQTMWSDDPAFVILQAQTIDGHQVGVRYIDYNDFKEIALYPEGYTFGKRVIIVPPGRHVFEIYYSGRANYAFDDLSQEHVRTLSYDADIPADSVCVLLPEFENYKVDMSDPKIRLECRAKTAPQ